MKACYTLLTVAFLCVLQPLVRSHIPHLGTVLVLALFVPLLILVVLALGGRRSSLRLSAYTYLGLYYGLLVAGIGLIHLIGMLDVSTHVAVNVQGLSMKTSLKEEAIFTYEYLFFPVMILGQYVFFKRLDFQWVLRVLGAAVGVSACVAIFQRFIDPEFLHSDWWGWVTRYEGLATDPNALGLTILLAIPFAVAGMAAEKKFIARAAYLALFFLLAVAEWGTQSRTSVGGTALFLLLLPMMVAWSQRRWGIKARAAMTVAPFLALALVIFALHTWSHRGSGAEGFTHRLAATWHKYEDGGISGVFERNEARGVLFEQTLKLIRMSPLAGWGPGGFYREHPNLAYRQHASVHMAHDSPLNHYLMIACDFGIPMMLLNLALILVPLFFATITFKRSSEAVPRFVALVLIISNGVFLLMINTMPPSYFLGVLWVWTALLAMMICMGENYGIRLGIPAVASKRRAIIVATAFMAAMILAAGFHTAFGEKGYGIRSTSPWWVAAPSRT